VGAGTGGSTCSILLLGQPKARAVITSKLTSKAQTTIPLPVRKALRLAEGDELAYTIEGDRVVLAKADRWATGNPFETFTEWSSEEDARAYADL
jgi:antitoxin PrlF